MADLDYLDMNWVKAPKAKGVYAQDIEESFTELSAEDESVRNKAIQTLEKAFVACDKVYGGAVKAIPELLNILKNNESETKVAVLNILFHIVTGGAWESCVLGADPKVKASKQRFARKINKRVVSDLFASREILYELFSHEDASIRSLLAALLAFDKDGAARFEEIISAQIPKEKDLTTKASLIISYSLLSLLLKKDTTKLYHQYSEDKNEPLLIRGAAQLGLIFQDGEEHDLTPKEKELLYEWTMLGKQDKFRYPWSDGDLLIHTTRSIFLRCEKHNIQAALFLADILEHCELQPKKASEIIEEIIEIGFSIHESVTWWEGPNTTVRDVIYPEAKDLSEDHRRLAMVLSSSQFKGRFQAHCLPCHVRDRRRWLGMEPQGPLDIIVPITIENKQYTQPLWRSALMLDRTNKQESIFDQLRSQLTGVPLLSAYGALYAKEYDTNYLISDSWQPLLDEFTQEEQQTWAREFINHTLYFADKFSQVDFATGSLLSEALDLLVDETDEVPSEKLDIYFSDFYSNKVLSKLPFKRKEQICLTTLQNRLDQLKKTRYCSEIDDDIELALKRLEICQSPCIIEVFCKLVNEIDSDDTWSGCWENNELAALKLLQLKEEDKKLSAVIDKWVPLCPLFNRLSSESEWRREFSEKHDQDTIDIIIAHLDEIYPELYKDFNGHSNKLTEETPFKLLARCWDLDLTRFDLPGFAPLTRLVSLRRLKLTSSTITDTEPLKKLVRLKKLELNGRIVNLQS